MLTLINVWFLATSPSKGSIKLGERYRSSGSSNGLIRLGDMLESAELSLYFLLEENSLSRDTSQSSKKIIFRIQIC